MAKPGTPAALSDRRWVILSVVAVAQLVVVLDAFTGEQMSFGTFELAAPGMVDTFYARAIDHPAGPGRFR
jgi:hypothetical protein